MSKLFFYDLETTGTRYWKNGIHQISGAIMIDGEIKEKFNFKVKPHKDCVIEDEALAVAGVTREQIALYPEMSVVYGKIISMLSKYVDKFKKTDKMYLVGYNNASFDNQFFRNFLRCFSSANFQRCSNRNGFCLTNSLEFHQIFYRK